MYVQPEINMVAETENANIFGISTTNLI